MDTAVDQIRFKLYDVCADIGRTQAGIEYGERDLVSPRRARLAALERWRDRLVRDLAVAEAA